jgi:CubicO group peptidase (beta-lactamase class C family)
MIDAAKLDELLQDAVRNHRIPGVIAAVSNRTETIYERAFGSARLGGLEPMRPDSVFWIASMTKAITAAAAMQLVEQGRLALDSPASDIVPALGRRQVLEGFSADGFPRLRPSKTPITLRHLLTHTSGLGYEWIHQDLARWCEQTGTPGILSCQNATLMTPLVSDPGTAWEYGTGIDWAGKMVEAVTGLSIGEYLRSHLLEPLGMRSTSFKLGDDQRSRLVSMHARAPDGTLSAIPFEVPQNPEFEMGGGGLYGTAGDYLCFGRMILRFGSVDGKPLLQPETVALMSTDQCPHLACGAFPSVAPAVSNPANFFPAQRQGWGLSFLINPQAVEGGRSANSLSWAGLANSYYWIDPQRGIAAVLAAQILPFFDTHVVDLLRAFEHAVYASIDR